MTRRACTIRSARLALLCAALLIPLASVAGSAATHASAGSFPKWDALADVEQIKVITHDEDGAERETTVWFAVVDGQGFIRTGSTTWGENVQRDPNLVLRIEDVEYPLTADFIKDETLRARITAAFREKYGWSDRLVGWMRGSRPKIMHMLPR